VKGKNKAAEDGIRLVLVMSQAEEAERLRERWLTREPGFHLLTAPGVAEALPYLTEWQADALVCDLAVLSAEAAAGVLNPAHPVPLVALVSPGTEERAVTLLTQGLSGCVVKAGNYDLLLAATLRRLVRQRIPGSSASAPLDFEELGMILRHEINNPLTGILGNAELILAAEPELPAAVHARVKTIIDLAVRLRDLVRNLEQTVNRQPGQAPGHCSSDNRVPESRAGSAKLLK
jgi:signal transduction histidine kinase